MTQNIIEPFAIFTSHNTKLFARNNVINVKDPIEWSEQAF